MALTPWSNTEIPDELDADDVPGAMATAFENIDTSLALEAASITDRDTRFADLPKGVLVRTVAEKALWIKTSDVANTWSGVEYEIQTTTGFVAGDNYNINGARLIRCNRNIELRYSLTRKNSSLVSDSHGNALDHTVLTIPSGWRPGGTPGPAITHIILASYYPAVMYVNSNGAVVFGATNPSLTLPIGSTLQGSAHWTLEAS